MFCVLCVRGDVRGCAVRILFLDALADAQALNQALPSFDDLLLLLGASLLLCFLFRRPECLVLLSKSIPKS